MLYTQTEHVDHTNTESRGTSKCRCRDVSFVGGLKTCQSRFLPTYTKVHMSFQENTTCQHDLSPLLLYYVGTTLTYAGICLLTVCTVFILVQMGLFLAVLSRS